MAGEHSIIPISAGARMVQCAGSVMMGMMHPETEESDDAREGTASHELATNMIDSFSRAGLDWPGDAVGQTASNGVVWTEESYEAALQYAEDVSDVMQRTGVFGGPNLGIERRIAAPRIHDESWGTPDCSLFDSHGGILYLWDYKFGHRVVDAVENWQLIGYAVGLLDEITGGNGLADQHIRIVMTVVQPRAYHRQGTVRRWEVMGSDLRGYANILSRKAHEALGPDPQCITGPECLDCHGRHACTALQRAAMTAVAYLGKPTPDYLDADALSLEKRILDHAAELIKARRTGIDAQIEAMIKGGGMVPGWALESGQSRQRWTVSPADVFALGDLLGVDLRKPEEPITPKQAIKAGIDGAVISAYSEIPSTALRLVEINGAATAAIFARK
jgi:hypothetical protein